MASASMRNITKPRNASIEVIRVDAGDVTAGACATVGAGADTVRCITPGILLPNTYSCSKIWGPAELPLYGAERLEFLLDPLQFHLQFEHGDFGSLDIQLASPADL